VNETAPLSTLLSRYREQLDHRMAAVDDLRREAAGLDPRVTADVVAVIDAVDDTVRQSDESARALLRWLQAGCD